jgi:DNA primase
LDLRELQQSGRIGRIKVELNSEGGKSHGKIIIPCSLDRVETAILAAALETVDRVGPCTAKIILEKVEDVREEKRRRIIERAIGLVRDWESEVSPDSQEVTDKVLRESRTAEIIKFGPDGLPAGPGIEKADTIIIVEGRADVLSLLRTGIDNVIAVEGTSIPKSIIELAKNKTVIAFLDGDRGGDLILRELEQVTKIDFVARAPTGREVEELTQKEITKALRNRIPFSQVSGRAKQKRARATQKISSKRQTKRTSSQKTKRTRGTVRSTKARSPTRSQSKRKITTEKRHPVIPDSVQKSAQKIQQTMMASILGEDFKQLKETHVGELAADLQSIEKAKVLLLDGVVTQRLVDIAEDCGIELIIGARVGSIVKRPVKMKIHTFDEL